jgi:hypothetical protein
VAPQAPQNLALSRLLWPHAAHFIADPFFRPLRRPAPALDDAHATPSRLAEQCISALSRGEFS